MVRAVIVALGRQLVVAAHMSVSQANREAASGKIPAIESTLQAIAAVAASSVRPEGAGGGPGACQGVSVLSLLPPHRPRARTSLRTTTSATRSSRRRACRRRTAWPCTSG